MSSSAPTSPKVAKSPKARSSSKGGAKKTASHPTYSAMIRKAVVELKDKSGSSKSAILKYILQNYKLGENVAKVNAQLRTAIKKGVIKGDLKQVKKPVAKKPASGASGEKKAATPKKKRSSSKKPKAEKKAKSPKKARKPKAKSAKKPSAAKSPKKSTMKKSKKVSKPKAAKKATTKA
ncbi:unnamed protein product [Cylicocyclus nassatus]|uniref:H15 domain-containing protein n=1 Tax=Cylicocyclus nassatus TaxID=53992 RepID=A0AA36M8H7_CYLNA|nr:unnamed protein product [Cylicocyclus nassatus]